MIDDLLQQNGVLCKQLRRDFGVAEAGYETHEALARVRAGQQSFETGDVEFEHHRPPHHHEEWFREVVREDLVDRLGIEGDARIRTCQRPCTLANAVARLIYQGCRHGKTAH